MYIQRWLSTVLLCDFLLWQLADINTEIRNPPHIPAIAPPHPTDFISRANEKVYDINEHPLVASSPAHSHPTSPTIYDQ